MQLGETIRQARVAAGMSRRAVGGALGISGQAVGKWEKGLSVPTLGNWAGLVELLGIDPRLVAFEEPGVYGPEPGSSMAPIYASISAGTPREEVESEGMVPVPATVIGEHPNGFFLMVSGECVNRVLPNGSYAFIDPEAEIMSGDLVAVLIDGHEATIKRYHATGNCVVLSPDSYDPTYKDQVFDYSVEGTDEVVAIGRVVWFTVPYSGRI